GIVETQSGEWWGFSMMDYNSIGRVTTLSPVTWVDGWPYFGLESNLTRAPRSWVKPTTGFESEPKALFQRNDDFSGPELNPIWQWNHHPVAEKWELDPRSESLNLTAQPAENFWRAKNTLTQRTVGPESFATAELDASDLEKGDIAGLALLNLPYAWLGAEPTANGLTITQFDQRTGKTVSVEVAGKKIWLRTHSDFDRDLSWFSYSTDGKEYHAIGTEFEMVYQLKTFQGVRFGLFAYNQTGREGGVARFLDFKVDEPRAERTPIPDGKTIKLTNFADSSVVVVWRNMLRPVSANNPLAQSDAALFKVIDQGLGRVSLYSVAQQGFVTVSGLGHLAEIKITKQHYDDASDFQWIDMLRDDLMLLSLKTHRYLHTDPHTSHPYSALSPGAEPNRKGGAVFQFKLIPHEPE
ncbi:MAG TPA: glycoside hydrolase, partial [Balneolaceae bacterium]|nr:glycoside hydrolase [Balneolaceae bacterium]